MHVCVICLGRLRRALISPKLEFWMVVIHHIGAGTEPYSSGFLTIKQLFQPRFFFK